MIKKVAETKNSTKEATETWLDEEAPQTLYKTVKYSNL